MKSDSNLQNFSYELFVYVPKYLKFYENFVLRKFDAIASVALCIHRVHT